MREQIDAGIAIVRRICVGDGEIERPRRWLHQNAVTGAHAVAILDKILQGDKSGIPDSKQIFVPTQIINKDNVVDFTAKINKLRGRG